MKSAWLVKGKINGIQKSFKSADWNELLPTEKRSELEDITEVGEYPRFFKKELVLAKSVVVEADNSDGRRGGIINFTVMYKWQKMIVQDDAPYVFDSEVFISEILAGKRRFKMPPMPALPDTDMGVICDPPPIEWEV